MFVFIFIFKKKPIYISIRIYLFIIIILYLAAALLEVLDPAQNTSFTDHFLNVPFDLSKILFIATANSLDTIPGPLLDRMEIIQLHGYTMDEKLDIARSHLLPKQLFAHGFSSKENDTVPTLNLSDEVLTHLIENYTMESGVRNLDRVIASVCRYKCREYADSLENNAITFNSVVLTEDLNTILGVIFFYFCFLFNIIYI